MTPNDYTKEEMKMFNETRKIMHSDVRTSATCVRVSSLRSHSESVWLETERALTVEEVRNALSTAPGVTLKDDPQNYVYPMPLESAGKDDVYVGRIRKDLAAEKRHHLWLTGDQYARDSTERRTDCRISVPRRPTLNKNIFFKAQDGGNKFCCRLVFIRSNQLSTAFSDNEYVFSVLHSFSRRRLHPSSK